MTASLSPPEAATLVDPLSAAYRGELSLMGSFLGGMRNDGPPAVYAEFLGHEVYAQNFPALAPLQEHIRGRLPAFEVELEAWFARRFTRTTSMRGTFKMSMERLRRLSSAMAATDPLAVQAQQVLLIATQRAKNSTTVAEHLSFLCPLRDQLLEEARPEVADEFVRLALETLPPVSEPRRALLPLLQEPWSSEKRDPQVELERALMKLSTLALLARAA